MYSFTKKRHLMLAVILTLSLLVSACTKSTDKTKTENSPVTTNTAVSGEEKPVEFSYMMITRFKSWMEDLNWYTELLKRTNAKVTLVDGGEGNQYYSNVDLRIGSGGFPDVGVVTIAQAEVYGSQGAFVDLTPLIDKYGPNIKKYMDENPLFKSLITASDGKIYSLLDEYPNISGVAFYREDMFKKAGITTEPNTIQALTEDFKILKKFYGSDKNYYPFSGREGFVKFTEAFHANDNIVDGKVQGIYENGLGMDIYSPGFKELITWYKGLYDEKLIDPEWVSGTSTEETWQTKMLNGKGTLSYDHFTRPAWFMLNGGPGIDPDYKIKALPYLLDSDGKQSVAAANPKYSLDRAIAINAKSADKAPGIIKFLDYLYSDEGKTLTGWGVEGQSYEEKDGKKQFIVDFGKETAKPAGEMKWSFLSDRLTFPMAKNAEAFYQWNSDDVKKFAGELFTDKYIKSYPIIKYSTEQLKDRSDLLAKVKDKVAGNLTKFVSGARPISEWDKFLSEMEKEGYKKIVEIDQAAYDKMK